MKIRNNAINWNSKAVSLLLQGKTREAASCLRNALIELKKQLNERSSTISQLDAPLEEQPISCVPIGESSSSVECATVDTAFTFFNRAFSMSKAITSQDHDRLTAIVLFNLALIHHCEGIQTGISQKLESAMCYYKSSLQAVCLASEQLDADSRVVLLLLALWNNMGNIHSQFFNNAETGLCVNWMQQLIECKECSLLEEKDYLFFFTNLLVNVQAKVAVAPAA